MTMTTEEKGQLFTQYQGLARKMALHFANRFGKPYEEMLDEAVGILGLKIASINQQYDPSKAKIITWLYRCLWHEMLNVCTRRRDKHIPFSTYDTEECAFEPAGRPTYLQRLLHNLGEEAQIVVQVIAHAPIEIAEEVTAATRSRGRLAVRAWLHDTEGWASKRVNKAWAEVAACL